MMAKYLFLISPPVCSVSTHIHGLIERKNGQVTVPGGRSKMTGGDCYLSDPVHVEGIVTAVEKVTFETVGIENAEICMAGADVAVGRTVR